MSTALAESQPREALTNETLERTGKRRRIEEDDDAVPVSGTAENVAESPFSTPIWTLAAGKTTFDVHAGVLIKSPKFRAQVDGKWRESKDRRIDLNWDPSAVARLVKWLYEKDYDCPYPVDGVQRAGDWLEEPSPSGKVTKRRDHEQQVRRRSTGVVSNTEDTSDFISNSRWSDDRYAYGGDFRDYSARSEDPYRRDVRDWPSMRERDPYRYVARDMPPNRVKDAYEILRKLVPRSQNPGTEGNKYEEWCETLDYRLGGKLDISVCDFGPTLTCHAEIYALANYALLQDLKDLAYQRLGTTLLFLQARPLDEAASVNIADLARCVYDKTDDSSAKPDPMRHLVSSFIAMDMSRSRFVGTEIDTLMSEGGPCAVDIAKNLCKDIEYRDRRRDPREAYDTPQRPGSDCWNGPGSAQSSSARGYQRH